MPATRRSAYINRPPAAFCTDLSNKNLVEQIRLGGESAGDLHWHRARSSIALRARAERSATAAARLGFHGLDIRHRHISAHGQPPAQPGDALMLPPSCRGNRDLHDSKLRQDHGPECHCHSISRPHWRYAESGLYRRLESRFDYTC